MPFEHELKNAYIGYRWTPGIFYKSSDGLISISGDGTTRITIADKNLGASNVGDYGYLFQWGNNYGFSTSGTPSKSSQSVSTSGYGPNNYYSNSTYITGDKDWSSPSNNDLWGDVTNTMVARKGPCNTGYHVPTATELQGIVNAGGLLGFNNGQWLVDYLRMPYSGLRGSGGGAEFQGSWGFYASSSTQSGDSTKQLFLQYNSSIIESSPFTSGIWKTLAFSIRPLKNTPEVPDSTRTVLYQPN